MASDLLAALVAALPTDAIITDPNSFDAYRWDRAYDPHAGMPAVVVRPTTTEQVQKVVRVAGATGTKIVTRGAGTGLSGGSTAVDGCIVLSLGRMREITIDPATRTARSCSSRCRSVARLRLSTASAD